MGKTYLHVSYANRAYALGKGALWDEKEKRFYVYGDVPVDLLGFTTKPEVKPIERQIGPACPECGCMMELRTNRKNGDQFWGCSTYPKCKGHSRYEPKSGLVQAAKSAIQDILGEVVGKQTAKDLPDDPNPERDTLVARVSKVYELAGVVIRGQAQVDRWLESPKIALGRRSPKEVLNTPEGCEQVERLLHDLAADEFVALLEQAVSGHDDLTAQIQQAVKQLERAGFSTKEINELVHDRHRRNGTLTTRQTPAAVRGHLRGEYKPRPATARTNLNVPFSEKDQAKALGAKWSKSMGTWYIDTGADLNKFARWLKGTS